MDTEKMATECRRLVTLVDKMNASECDKDLILCRIIAPYPPEIASQVANELAQKSRS